jgi:Fusaric acid resistance protein family
MPLVGRPTSALSTLAFGLRMWASVCLALYVAFWLELDNPFWAGTTAAIVCQPQLGASLRKGWFRMIGTLVGAVMSVVLVACFPQDRALFLGGLALWGAACSFAATLLRNFASYAAALAGYTVAIVAGDLLGATGGVNADAAFLVAVTRASEVCIGIVSAGVVLAVADARSKTTVKSRYDYAVEAIPHSDRSGTLRAIAAGHFGFGAGHHICRVGARKTAAGEMSSGSRQPIFNGTVGARTSHTCCGVGPTSSWCHQLLAQGASQVIN